MVLIVTLLVTTLTNLYDLTIELFMCNNMCASFQTLTNSSLHEPNTTFHGPKAYTFKYVIRFIVLEFKRK